MGEAASAAAKGGTERGVTVDARNVGARDGRRRVGWLAVPTMLLLVASAAFAVWIIISSVRHLDDAAVDGEKRLAASALNASVERLSNAVADYSFWDETYDQFNGTYDPAWSFDNLDAYILGAFDLDLVLVAGASGEVRYRYSRASGAAFAIPAADLLGIGRAADIALRGWTPGKATTIVGVVSIAGKRYLAASAPISVSTETRIDPRKPPTLALIYLEALDDARMKRLSNMFQLANARIVPLSQAAVRVPDAFGIEPPVGLTWTPSKLGDQFLTEVLPLTIAALLVGLGAFAAATLGWVRIAGDLSRALNAAESGSRAKSQFLAMMSHEIRTPMNGVLGMTNQLLDGALSDDQRRAATTIRESGETLLRILNDALDFSKLEAGAMAIEETAFDLENLLSYAVEIVSPRAQAKRLAVDVALAPGLPPFLRSDAGRLRQVVLNLLGNAVKFTEHGSVHLYAAAVKRGEAEFLRVSVTDTGIGIAADKIGQLFQSFAQADASISRRFGGSGLGLAISKMLVELLGGTIGVDSVEGQGSTFWFEVPLKPASEADAQASAELATERDVAEATAAIAALGRPLRLLVVEDNATNVLVAQAVLAKFDIMPDVAGNGIEALEMVRRASYDVILMDVHMPEMGGLEATRAIRAMPAPKGGVPIIALTANAFGSDVEACRDAGMNAHVGKPFRRETLIVAIAEALQGKTGARAAPAVPAATGDGPVIDWAVVERFRAESGEEMLRLLIDTYLEDSAAKLARLTVVLAGGASEEAVRLAHSMKSASAMAGATALARAAAALEVALTRGASAQAGEAERLQALFEAYRAALVEKGLAA